MKKIAVYTLVGLLSPALSLLLLPIYLRYLSQNEYVILALSNSFFALFSVFLNLKVDQAYRTIYFYNLENKVKQLALFRTLFSFQILSFLAWLIIFYFGGNLIFNLVYDNKIPFSPFALIILISFMLGSLSNFYFIQLQNKLEIKKYSLYSISGVLLIHILQLSCVYIFKIGFIWFLLSSLFSNLLIFLLVLLKNRDLFQFSISKNILKEVLKFSLPFIPFLILYNIENQLDRFYINKYLSVEELAKYAVLMSVTSAVITLFNSVDNAVRPELYSFLSDSTGNSNSKIQKQIDFYLFTGIVLFSFLVAFGTNIHWFLNNSKYNGIHLYFSWIAIAFLPIIWIRYLALILIYENKISKINYFAIAKIVLMCICFYILIPIFKTFGAIITIGLSNIINVFIFYFILNIKVFPSMKINFYLLLFVAFNLFLMLGDNSKFVYLFSLFQFVFFGILFIFNYKVRLIKIFQKINLN